MVMNSSIDLTKKQWLMLPIIKSPNTGILWVFEEPLISRPVNTMKTKFNYQDGQLIKNKNFTLIVDKRSKAI